MKIYKKGAQTSYTLGVFPTIELLTHAPEQCLRVVVHSSITENSGYPLIKQLCGAHHIPIDVHDATIQKLSPKNNCYAIGVFRLYARPLDPDNHVVLVNPMDMGNMGTILRTMLGFDYHDLVIIKPCVDVYNPKVVRASMGAIFAMHIALYDRFEDYLEDYPDHVIYPFMLKGADNIHQVRPSSPHTLVFGNESSGLDDSYLQYGQSVFIPHSAAIDSLNLSQSLGIALYHFSSDVFKERKVLRDDL